MWWPYIPPSGLPWLYVVPSTYIIYVRAHLDLLSIPVRPCLNVLTESVHKICRQNLSKIKLCDWPNKLDSTSWQVWTRQNLSKWTDSNNCFGNYFFLSVSWICRADPKTCVLHKFCRAKWFDGKKKNTHLLRTGNSTTETKKRKDVSSCYILETVQMKPIKKKTNSCYVLETV